MASALVGMKNSYSEKAIVAPDAIGENDAVYKLFCNNSPRVVARYLINLKRDAREGAIVAHDGHDNLFISPHAILEKCPAELIDRMNQTAKIMQRMEGEARTNLVDSLYFLFNWLKEICNSGVSGTKIDEAIFKLHEISVNYVDRHHNEPAEPTATKVHNFVTKLEEGDHYRIGTYSVV